MYEARKIRQIGALPFVAGAAAVEYLLITSRERGRWIIPKGWPEEGLTAPATAAVEAEEEAGLIGPVDSRPLFSYDSMKELKSGQVVPSRISVYPMLVIAQQTEWLEKSERSLAWMTADIAAETADDDGLARFMKRLAATGDRKIREVAARLTPALASYLVLLR